MVWMLFPPISCRHALNYPAACDPVEYHRWSTSTVGIEEEPDCGIWNYTVHSLYGKCLMYRIHGKYNIGKGPFLKILTTSCRGLDKGSPKGLGRPKRCQ